MIFGKNEIIIDFDVVLTYWAMPLEAAGIELL